MTLSLVGRRHFSGACLLLMLHCLCLMGCGNSNRPKTIPVTGTITFGGGPWPKPGEIYFTCVEPEAGFPRKPGLAQFDTNGAFVAGSFTEKDGLVPGTYRMSVECWEVRPNMDGIPAKSYLPDKYLNPAENGLEDVIIKSTDGRRELTLDIPNRR